MRIRRFFQALWVAVSVLAMCELAIAMEATSHLQSETKPDESNDLLMTQFIGTEWIRVKKAARALESQQGRAIPYLVALLDNDQYVKLIGTFDLIYPGAEKYYGHGGIVRYDIDWLTVRAGWVLENITFQDFGFSEDILEEDLFEARFSGKVDGPLRDAIPIIISADVRQLQRVGAIKRCKHWWSKQDAKWDRFTALTDALKSGQPSRAMKAIQWLRFGTTSIDGFSKKTYVRQVLPLLKTLAKSSEPQVATQAGYLVQNYKENEWWWLEQKN